MDGTLLAKKLKLIEKLKQLDEIAQKIDDMPVYTSVDRAWLTEWEEKLPELPAMPTEDGETVLKATTREGETVLSWWQGGGLPDYSAEEQLTGQKWIDGKDIYVKVVTLSEVLTVQSQTWTDTNIDSSYIDSLIDAKIYDANSVNFAMNVAKMNGDLAHITVMQFRSTQVGINRVVLWYTKSSLARKSSKKKMEE